MGRQWLHAKRLVAGLKKGWQTVPIENRPRYIGDFEELAACIRSASPLSSSRDHDLHVQEALLKASGVAG